MTRCLRGRLVVVALLCVAGAAFAADKVDDTSKSLAEIKGLGDKMMQAWAKGDWETIHSTISESM